MRKSNGVNYSKLQSAIRRRKTALSYLEMKVESINKRKTPSKEPRDIKNLARMEREISILKTRI